MAEVWSETGQFEKAVRAYDVALQLDATLHRAQLGLALTLDVCDVDLSEREPPRLRTMVWEALQALDALLRDLQEGRTPRFVDVPRLRAEKEMRRRLARNPSDADAMFLQSALLAKEGAFEEAIAMLDHLADRGVDYPGAREFRNHLKKLIASMSTGASLPGSGSVPRP